MSLLHIETPRLILRPFVPSDAPAAVRFLRDPDVIRFMAATPLSEGEAEDAIRGHTAGHYDRLGFGALAGVLKSTGAVVGRYGLQRVLVDGIEETEITYLTGAEYRCRGLASEAVRAVLDAASRGGMSRIIALIRPDNVVSQGLAEGVGFRYVRDVVQLPGVMRLYLRPTMGDPPARDE